MARIVAGVLGLMLAANALAMLLAAYWWYGQVPGVPQTGPYNPHFVRDIGAAYLVTAAGLGWFAWRPAQGWPALAIGAGFLTLHAAIHVYDVTCGTTPLSDVLRDLVGVYLPAVLALAIALMPPKETASC
jgi:hypothetical protein